MTDTPNPAGNAYGLSTTLGFRRTVYQDGFARMELDLDQRHMNRMEVPHGGIYATLLDSALGAAGSWSDDERGYLPAVTLNLNISFIAVPKGRHLICEGRRVGGGKSIYFSEGEVTDETGMTIARASGTFKVFTPR